MILILRQDGLICRLCLEFAHDIDFASGWSKLFKISYQRFLFFLSVMVFFFSW